MPEIEDIELKLQEIEKIEVDGRAENVQDLIDIRSRLEYSKKESTAQEMTRLDELEQRYEHLVAPVADSLQEEAVAQVSIYQNGQIPTDLNQFQKGLAAIQGDLNQIVDLIPVRRTQPAFMTLEKQLKLLLDKVSRKKQLSQLETEIQGFWEHAKTIEKAAPNEAIEDCQQALRRTRDEKAKDGWEPDERDKLFLLEHEARERYDDIRERHEIPITKTSGDEIVEVVIQFAKLAKEDPETPVTYFESAKEQTSKSMSVTEALEIAKDRLLIFWSEKIEKYIKSSEAALEAHKPRAAMRALSDWRILPGLNDERIGLKVRPDDIIRINYIDDLIKPELEELQKAEQWAAKAERESNPLEAHKAWQTAKEIFPYYSNLEQIREKILELAETRIKSLLHNIEKAFGEEQWGLGKARLNEATDLINLDSRLSDQFQVSYDNLERLYRTVEPLTRRGKMRLKISDEKTVLENLELEYQDSYWSDWPRLTNRLAELRARSSVEALELEANKLCHEDGSLAALAILFRDAQNIFADPPQALTPTDSKRLKILINRLKAWHGYAQAREELDKVRRLANKETSSLPDLVLAKQGLEAAREELETARVLKELEEKFNHFSSKDDRAYEALGKAKNLLDSNAQDTLEQAEKWVKEVTSYRIEFLELRNTAQQRLASQIENELRDSIAKAKNDRFLSLEVDHIEALLNRAEELHLEKRRVEEWRSLTAGPLAVAKAYQRQKQIGQGSTNWLRVKESWEEAAQLVTDEDLQDYCARQAKEALKNNEFLRARRFPEKAEAILRNLCEDPVLQENWEVWYEHGQHCLAQAQDQLRQAQPEAAKQLLETARESLNRGRRLSTVNMIDIAHDQFMQIDSMLEELNDWEHLAKIELDILFILQRAQSRLTAVVCREANRKFTNSRSTLVGDDFRRLFEGFWDGQLIDVRSRLENQLKEATKLSDQVDILIAMRLLWSDDNKISMKLTQRLGQAISDVRNQVEHVVDDAGAQKFRWRYEQEHRRLALKDKEPDIAQLQLEQARHLSDHIRNMKLVRDMVIGQIDDLAQSVAGLDKEADELNGWIENLEKLLNSKGEAIQLAEAGLRRPERFETAKYILRLSNENVVQVEQVPQMFRDKGHPTYSWCVEQVERLEARRQKQEQFKRKIDWCLRFAHVSRADQLPSTADDSAEKAVIEKLRKKFQQSETAGYPIEEALRLMQEMIRNEPEDACGLQNAITYLDPDDGNRLYETPQSIQRVIQQKVTQIHTLRRWLEQFTSGIVVEWPQLKPEIARLRDSGPEGLHQARKLCQKAKTGNEQGLFDDVRLSLGKAADALSEMAMETYLRENMGLSDQNPVILCAVARNIAKNRQSLQQKFRGQTQECQVLETDINRRLNGFNGCWDEFRYAFQDLMAMRRPWFGKNYSDTAQWRRFQEAAYRFCAICPNYSEFRDALRQARAKTNIEIDCSA